MTTECVCGFNPPEDPNPDCERCMLICRIAELETACRAALETLRMQIKREREEFHIPHYTAKAIWDETIAELEAAIRQEKAGS